MKKDRLQTFKKTLKTTNYMLRHIWLNGKSYIICKVCKAILNSLYMIMTTLLPGLIINELIEGGELRKVVIYISLITISPIIFHLINVKENEYTTTLSNKIKVKFTTDFYYRLSCMDFELLEDPDFQMKKERAASTINAAFGVVTKVCEFVSSLLGMIAIFSLIVTLNIYIIIVVAITVVINHLVTKKTNENNYKIDIEIDESSRYEWAADYMLNNKAFAKELRLYGLKDLLNKNLENALNKMNVLFIGKIKNQHRASMYYTITQFIQSAFAYSYLAYKVVTGAIRIGDMTIYLGAINQFASSLSSVSESYLVLCNDSMMITELMDFMSLPLNQYDYGNMEPSIDENSVIEFKDVSFKYPGSDRYALDHVNLKISGNERLCIVGENGSGKSTFIKLLTRLYSPTQGEILLNGINIKEYNYEKYKKAFFTGISRFYSFLSDTWREYYVN